MTTLSHLRIEEFLLPAGGEWKDTAPAWRFVMIRSGAAYWLGQPAARQLSASELIIAAPNKEVLIRASLLGEIRIVGFAFDPELLCGFLTLQERQTVTGIAQAGSPLRFLPSTHEASRALQTLLEGTNSSASLVFRVHLLTIVAAAFDDELKPGIVRSPQRAKTTDERFRELVGRMPDLEFINHTPEELAHFCGCSPRHFSRLFLAHFGTSARQRQTELRLLKAKQLLAESDAKIVQVALESGYRNLSLFNSLFKRKFNMTPSEWRKKFNRASRRATALLAVATHFVVAQLAAGAGATNAAPVANTNANPVFEVRGYELEGNTLLPDAVTQPLLQPHTGTAVSFEEIRKALGDLQLAYRDRGYITVSVSLPPQQLTNGFVQFKVVEGRLAEVRVVGNKHFSTANVLRALPSVQTNELLNSLLFQQELDRANANRDRQIYPVISPGPDPGTSALELRVKDQLPLHARMDFNNYSTPGSPETRLNLSAVANNLWQLEHQLGVQYSLTPEQFKDGNYNFYDQPLIANYSAFYKLPIGPVNGGTRNVWPTDFGYDEVTHRFRPPPVSTGGEFIAYVSRSFSDTAELLQSETLTPAVVPPEGTLQVSDRVFSRTLNPTENVGFRLNEPVGEWEGWKVNVALGMDYKRYRSTQIQDRIFQATVFVPTTGSSGPPFTEFTSPPTFTTRSINTGVEYLPFSLNFDAMRADKSGYTAFTLNQTVNIPDALSSHADFQAAVGSTNVTGNFYIVSASATREQKLWREWGVKFHADGQWANEPLLSTEQFGLGGLAGVRGYRDGQQYGDYGWRATVEPHSPWLNLGMVDNTVPFMARLYTFVDYGQRFLLEPGGRDESVSMLGTGCGIDAAIGQHTEFKLMFGVPLQDVPGRNAGELRVQFSLVAQF